jgi:hypothetical protein
VVYEPAIVHIVHKIEENFDARENYRRICVLQMYDDPFCQELRIGVKFGNKAEQRVKYIDLAPS